MYIGFGEFQTIHLRPKQHFAINLTIRPDIYGDTILDQTEPMSASKVDFSVLRPYRGNTGSIADITDDEHNNHNNHNRIGLGRSSRATSNADTGSSSDTEKNNNNCHNGSSSVQPATSTILEQQDNNNDNCIVWWEWLSSTKDLEFEVDFITTTHGSINVVPHSTVKHGQNVVRGRYIPPPGLSGNLRLTWSNHASWLSNKTLKYRTGIKHGNNGITQPPTPLPSYPTTPNMHTYNNQQQ